VVVAPDLARVSIGVERVEPSLQQALDAAARDMNAVIERLVQLGVAREEIKTVHFAVSPVYAPREPATLQGYRVTNVIQATIRGLERVGPILDQAVAAGATRVHSIEFDTSRLPELKDQAREQAMANARAKAEQLARLAGVTLGPVVSIEESDTGGAPPVPAATARAADAATPIEGGQLEVRTTVRVTWAIG
jgi:uncharacterized protein YggE